MRARRGLILAFSLAVPLLASSEQTRAAPAASGGVWVGSWASAEQTPEPADALAPADLSDATLRQVVHLSVGGGRIRVRLSNAFGHAPLQVASAHVALAVAPASAAIVPASDRVLTFSGATETTIPAGAEYWSDPVGLPVAPLSNLAVSLHLSGAPGGETGHPGSRATSYLVHGDRAAAPDLPEARKVEHWYFLSGVDVAAGPGASAVVTFGDSITDGHGATKDGNARWPDVLAERLQASPATRRIGVLNEGIGGNRVLLDGLGPNAMARLDRDVLAQTGVRSLIVLEGVNDLGTLTHDAPVSPQAHTALVDRLLAAYAEIAAEARAHGIQVIGATIMPFGGSGYYHPDEANEADRRRINTWIRTPGHFDAVIDFDRVVRDPAHPDRLGREYDSGDHLHPSPAGYRAMAEAVPLDLFRR